MFDLKPYTHNNHSLATDNPFHDMEEFERSFFNSPFGFFGNNMLSEFKTDITDAGDTYQLQADLPGFKKEDIHLDLEGDVLTVRAQRHSEYEEKDKKDNYIRCERSYGAYSRRFDVSGVETEGIKAKYEDGVLKLTLPKKASGAEATRHLEIE
ncbi:MAG: Hsp20/alpha crystallin family protein [Eubacteriales bacterium]|nr:Hsp20/alpha crystallin family protein [Eubacteriales bacterium]